MPPAVYAKCQSTMYKQGQQPHNTASANGAISLRKYKDGHTYQFIRIALGKWLPLHQQIWLTANQPYNTSTHCLWFINGNSLDARLDNLQLITRGENARRNHTKHLALPPQLQTTKKLINKLKTKITANAKHTI